jgi:hypothetical protein
VAAATGCRVDVACCRCVLEWQQRDAVRNHRSCEAGDQSDRRAIGYEGRHGGPVAGVMNRAWGEPSSRAGSLDDVVAGGSGAANHPIITGKRGEVDRTSTSGRVADGYGRVQGVGQ